MSCPIYEYYAMLLKANSLSIRSGESGALPSGGEHLGHSNRPTQKTAVFFFDYASFKEFFRRPLTYLRDLRQVRSAYYRQVAPKYTTIINELPYTYNHLLTLLSFYL